jgi:hypothetical protein
MIKLSKGPHSIPNKKSENQEKEIRSKCQIHLENHPKIHWNGT